ncbi:MAG: hypothetical protein LW884_08140 [Bacteroidetes bacterium]|jgi:hypothetical protein|nr:hypothetical protein [Bacteroidota bacterium]
MATPVSTAQHATQIDAASINMVILWKAMKEIDIYFSNMSVVTRPLPESGQLLNDLRRQDVKVVVMD